MLSRPRFIPSALAGLLVLFVLGAGTVPARAANKDMIQLQTQVQQLQDALARLQQSNDENMGVLKSLVQQTADSVNKMTVVVNGMQLHMQNQQDAAASKSDQLSGQIQSLNDSLDELKARMARMEKSLSDIQSAQQTTNAALSNLPQGAGGAESSGQPAGPPPNGNAPVYNSGKPAPGTPLSALTGGSDQQALPVPAPTAGPSAGELYRTAYGDYIAGKYPLASSEFQELIKAYPDDNLSGNGYFYIGEMSLRGNKPSLAIKDYDHVLEHYPDNSKIPAAHLHKADALVATHQNEAGVREYRALIQRFPNSPEAAQARAKLSQVSRR
ncbi:MAG TPA: tetratricopeptide repeat protein [Acidobacteriaceae bacterium]